MEKGPDFKIVGSVSPEVKEQARKELEHKLFNHLESLPDDARDRMRKHEYPKDDKELAVIDLVNKENNILMEKYGLEPYSVPADNFHLIPHELYEEHISKKNFPKNLLPLMISSINFWKLNLPVDC